jgi:hypothetical protein
MPRSVELIVPPRREGCCRLLPALSPHQRHGAVARREAGEALVQIEAALVLDGIFGGLRDVRFGSKADNCLAPPSRPLFSQSSFLVAIPVPMMVVARIVGVVAMMVAIVAMMVAVVAIKIRIPPRRWISSSGRPILGRGYRGSAHQQGRRQTNPC